VNSDKDFLDDPLFKGLKKFASTSDAQVDLPSDIAYTLRNAGIRSTRQKVVRRSVFTIITASVVLPSLSFAHVLPTPIDNIVKSVVHLVSTPVRVISNVINDPAPTIPAPSGSVTTTPEPATLTPTSEPITPTPTPTPAPTKTLVPQAPAPAPTRTHTETHTETPKTVSPPKPAVGGGEKENEGEGEGEERGIAPTLPKATLPSAPNSKPSIPGGGRSEGHTEGKSSEGEGHDD